jgi:hypothetical protein
MDEGGRLFFPPRSCLPFFEKFHQIHYCSYCDSSRMISFIKAATAWATLHNITTGSFSTLDLPIVAETEHLSYFSGKVHPSGADCPFFMELYNSVNVHDIEKSKIMLHGIKTLLEWAIWQEISAMLLLINVK